MRSVLSFSALLLSLNLVAQIESLSHILGSSAEQLSYAIDLDATGQYLLVSAPFNNDEETNAGKVQLYQRDGNSCKEKGKPLYGDNADHRFGFSLELSSSGLSAIVGSIGSINNVNAMGSVEVFDLIGDEWLQRGDRINGRIMEDRLGINVDISGDGQVIAFGSHWVDSTYIDQGVVQVLAFENGKWENRGAPFYGVAPSDQLGNAIELSKSGNILIMNRQSNLGQKVDSYKWTGSEWEALGKIDDLSQFFGTSLKLSADEKTLAISEISAAEFGRLTGALHTYSLVEDEWVKMGTGIIGQSSGEQFGSNIALSADGTTLVASAQYFNQDSLSSVGTVRVYKLKDGDWVQNQNLIFIGEQHRQRLGGSLALSDNGQTLCIGSTGFTVDSGNDGLVECYLLEGNPSNNSERLRKSISIYPNPCTDVLYFDSKGVKSAKIQDILGRIIHTESHPRESLDVSKLRPGYYRILLEHEKGMFSIPFMHQ